MARRQSASMLMVGCPGEPQRSMVQRWNVSGELISRLLLLAARQLASLANGWPLDYDEFCSYYIEAEKLFGICGTRDPLDPDDDSTLNAPPALSELDQYFFQSFNNAGLHLYRGQTVRNRYRSRSYLEVRAHSMSARLQIGCCDHSVETSSRSARREYRRWVPKFEGFAL